MQIAIHLPQYGRCASPQAIASAAVHAEQLGFAGLWVSDHVISPVGQDYPSPFLYDPLACLAFVAALTTDIGLGTSVIVAPQRNPVELANSLASIDNLSGGRLTIGLGVGWSRAEFAALDRPFEQRGRRTDEIIDALRVLWSDDPAEFAGDFVQFEPVRMLPKPAHEIPIWVAGSSPSAHRRAVARGDGFHAIAISPEDLTGVVVSLRAERPEPSFTVSLRTGWDPQGMDPDRIRRELDEYAEAGVSYVVSAPWRNSLDEWLRSMELLAELGGLTPR